MTLLTPNFLHEKEFLRHIHQNSRSWLWQYGLSSYQGKYTKLGRFLTKNQRSARRKLLYFMKKQSAEISKSAKIWLENVKNHLNRSDLFFSLKSSIQVQILIYWHFLIASIFRTIYFLNWCTIFDGTAMCLFTK